MQLAPIRQGLRPLAWATVGRRGDQDSRQQIPTECLRPTKHVAWCARNGARLVPRTRCHPGFGDNEKPRLSAEGRGFDGSLARTGEGAWTVHATQRCSERMVRLFADTSQTSSPGDNRRESILDANRTVMLPNPSATIVYQVARQISTSLFTPEAVNSKRSANGMVRPCFCPACP
jgi:hypothetical protein